MKWMKIAKATGIMVVHAIVMPISVFADSGFWTDREICRAAVKTYFFLDQAPTNATNQGEYFGFISAAGNIYTCRLDRERAVLRWLTESGEMMHSEVTRFRVSDGILTIKTDMGTNTFEK